MPNKLTLQGEVFRALTTAVDENDYGEALARLTPEAVAADLLDYDADVAELAFKEAGFGDESSPTDKAVTLIVPHVISWRAERREKGHDAARGNPERQGRRDRSRRPR